MDGMKIDEIAKKATVSRSTVSRVLNNNPKVKLETRQLVNRVIQEMNYVPNAAARSLASKRSGVIG
ncbi:MAG: LacI family DNA-binding transcriptional regulator, partial [Raoultibacter sp.]